ncbi:VacJ family lipoprotein [Crenothrix polyspora]|uniref:Surface lipoprotein n=1 Tax=Crenothrix polyspora TaxID=360316 RepID=A0A1R4H1Z1_9GAMM|nr:VacJ family lipoprotein [Crenothrix polyspora]SJM89849.1 Surface lipoprotein [Crenothrix polyspora]
MNLKKHTPCKQLTALGFIIAGNFIGCAAQQPAKNPADPWESWNRTTSSFNNDVDKAILKPMAKSYKNTAPKPINTGVTNFFSNISDIGVSVNDLLQLKFLQSGMDVSRFVINSTAGLGGIFDVASKLKLPKHNEDFGQTLGFWGVPSGSYTVLPFFGASSPRDAVGLVGDALLNPLTYVSMFGGVAASAATTGTTVLDVTDTRSDLMSTEKIVDEGAIDRYDFIKNAYTQHREYLIHDGSPPTADGDDLLADQPDTNSTDTGIASTQTLDPSNSSGGLGYSSDGIPVIDNSKKLPPIINAPVPIIDNSKRFLELSAPD